MGQAASAGLAAGVARTSLAPVYQTHTSYLRQYRWLKQYFIMLFLSHVIKMNGFDFDVQWMWHFTCIEQFEWSQTVFHLKDFSTTGPGRQLHNCTKHRAWHNINCTLHTSGDPVRADIGDGVGPGPVLCLRRDLLREPPPVPVSLPGLEIL